MFFLPVFFAIISRPASKCYFFGLVFREDPRHHAALSNLGAILLATRGRETEGFESLQQVFKQEVGKRLCASMRAPYSPVPAYDIFRNQQKREGSRVFRLPSARDAK